jgi:hypothetical protein
MQNPQLFVMEPLVRDSIFVTGSLDLVSRMNSQWSIYPQVLQLKLGERVQLYQVLRVYEESCRPDLNLGDCYQLEYFIKHKFKFIKYLKNGSYNKRDMWHNKHLSYNCNSVWNTFRNCKHLTKYNENNIWFCVVTSVLCLSMFAFATAEHRGRWGTQNRKGREVKMSSHWTIWIKFPNFLEPQAIYYVDFPWQTTRTLYVIFKEFWEEWVW